jgi:hypothetical protein
MSFGGVLLRWCLLFASAAESFVFLLEATLNPSSTLPKAEKDQILVRRVNKPGEHVSFSFCLKQMSGRNKRRE